MFAGGTHRILILLLYITFLLILTAILTGVVRPYKSYKYNIVDVVLILILAVIPLMSALILASRAPSFGDQLVIIIVSAVLPLVYIVVISLHWIVIRKKVPQRMLHRVWMLLPCTRALRQRRLEELLPDRMANPEECAALLKDPMAVDQGTATASGGLDYY